MDELANVVTRSRQLQFVRPESLFFLLPIASCLLPYLVT